MGTSDSTGGPEIVIGLVGAVGTDLRGISHALTQELRRVDYQPYALRLSELILNFSRFAEIRGKAAEDERVSALMQAGDDVRAAFERGDAVALLAIAEIQRLRQLQHGDPARHLARTAFILHSLKTPQEIATLRSLYGDSFFLISVYAPRSTRRRLLCERIARSRQEYEPAKYTATADDLIERDLREVGTDFGQDVRGAFPEADFFLDATHRKDCGPQIARFVDILFGQPYVTPNVDEYGMFHAKAAALRSSDLSRQVGAVITTDDGEIVSAGCNEVPKSGGGAVWDGEPQHTDYRDFQIGHDASAWMKHELVTELFAKLSGWLAPDLRGLSAAELATRALYEGKAPPLRGTRADSLLEFGRIVHAEMSAITEAARRGVAVRGMRLYCTTFPCHMCARHIVAAGLQQVIYIEPYPKSMAKELYRKSISADDDGDSDPNAVRFRPFVGVSPRKFLEFFEMKPRKDRRGHVLAWDGARAMPRIRRIVSYRDAENAAVELVVKLAVRLEPMLNASISEVDSDG